jgi:hypothetical protein
MAPPSDLREKRRLKFQNLILVREIPVTVHLLLDLLPPPRIRGEAELIRGGCWRMSNSVIAPAPRR